MDQPDGTPAEVRQRTRGRVHVDDDTSADEGRAVLVEGEKLPREPQRQRGIQSAPSGPMQRNVAGGGAFAIKTLLAIPHVPMEVGASRQSPLQDSSRQDGRWGQRQPSVAVAK